MKKYYRYSETNNQLNFYKIFKIKREIAFAKPYVDRRIHIDYCAFCNKKDFIDIIGARIHSKNWVRERVMETGNIFDISLADSHPDSIIIYLDEPNLKVAKGTILEIIPIKRNK